MSKLPRKTLVALLMLARLADDWQESWGHPVALAETFVDPHLIAGFLALIALAMFSGVRRGPQDLAEYASTFSQGQLRALMLCCSPNPELPGDYKNEKTRPKKIP